MKKQFFVVYGTEESVFESWVKKFDTQSDAEEFIFAFEEENEEYETMAFLCTTEEEVADAKAEIASVRAEILEELGFDDTDE